MARESTENIVARCIERWRSSLDSLRNEHPESVRVLDRLLTGVERSHERELDWELTRSISESLRARVGQDVDPGIELVKDDAHDPNVAGTELLRAMRERGPASRRYDVKEEIGRGGMGAVLRVYDRELHRHLAMKVLLDGTGRVICVDSKGDMGRLARFLEEAQVTAQLDHPGIVPVHELGIDDQGRIYFTMKLVKGETLSAVFQKVEDKIDGWNRTRVLWTLLRVCEAMEFAHRRNVVHRDLKPSNIMVGEFGEAYVMDFGLARVLDRDRTAAMAERGRSGDSGILDRHVFTDRGMQASVTPDSPLVTNSGERLGTPAYMAPEQARGEIDSIGPHTDVYAVGAILYQVLTGCAPYLEEGRPSPISIITRVQREPPVPVHRLNRKIDGELQSICEKAMAREIADRYPTMAELAADLRAYLENRVVRAHRSGAFVDLRKWVKRNRAAAYASLAAACIAMFGLAAVVALEVLRESDLARADARLQARQRNLEEVQKQRKEVQKQLDETSAKRAASDEELERRNSALAELEAKLETARTEVTKQEAELKRAKEDLAAQSNDVRELDERSRELTKEVTTKTEALAKSEEAVRAAEEARKDAETSLKEQLAKLNRAVADAESERRRLALELQPLADLKQLVDLVEEEGRLWPARPEMAPALGDWIERAKTMLASIAERGANEPAAAPPDSPHVAARREVATRAVELANTVLPRVEMRLSWALRVRELTIDERKAEWAAAIAAIANHEQCPAYGGLAIEPIEGLVPLGRSAASGLYEFWHPESGDAPVADEHGVWQIAPETGIVLVLVPGGAFEMGAHALDFLALPDARGRREEQPKHVVVLDPFLISKYELTQAQWQRCGGSGGTVRYRAGERAGGRMILGTNPVESITWDEARRALQRVELELPTEAQWEYAARGGTETPWWSGLEPRDAWLAGNVADEYARTHGGEEWAIDRRLDDGHLVHAPVGSFRANPFGLCDVIGNVAEWCLDEFGSYSDRVEIASYGEHRYREFDGRAFRGGSFRDAISAARSSARASLDPGARSDRIGARPVLNLPPKGESR
jgi:formylglycine-generating enzyme required for sulfatase activity/serine/threonine protein kinase